MTKLIIRILLIIVLLSPVPALFIASTNLVFAAEICDDGVDNDGDYFVDLDDSDCQTSGGSTGCSGFLDCLGDIEVSDLKYKSEQGFVGRLLSDILPIILGLGGFLAVIFIIISGIQFITSSGNPEGAAAARGRLIYALIGFGLIALAFAVLQIVNQLFLGTTVV